MHLVDKSSTRVGQDNISSDQQRKTRNNEEGDIYQRYCLFSLFSLHTSMCLGERIIFSAGCHSCELQQGTSGWWGCSRGASKRESDVPSWSWCLWGIGTLSPCLGCVSVSVINIFFKQKSWWFIWNFMLQDEPYMKPGLADMKNAIVVPHIASASKVLLLSPKSSCIPTSHCTTYHLEPSTDQTWKIKWSSDQHSETKCESVLCPIWSSCLCIFQYGLCAVDSWRNGNAGCPQCPSKP